MTHTNIPSVRSEEGQHLYHVLHNAAGKIVFVQQEEWGKYSVALHQLIVGVIKCLPRNPEVYCAFWNPANPQSQLDERWILLIHSAESIVDACYKSGEIWWGLTTNEIAELRRPVMRHSTLPPSYREEPIPISVHPNTLRTPASEAKTLPRMRATVPPPLPPQAHRENVKRSGSYPTFPSNPTQMVELPKDAKEYCSLKKTLNQRFGHQRFGK